MTVTKNPATSKQQKLLTTLQTALIVCIALIVLVGVLYWAINLLQDELNNPAGEGTEEETVGEGINAVSGEDVMGINIIDGDTFETSGGEIIRLLCVDAPEKDKEGYEDARAYLSNLVLGKQIVIEREGVDKYNRTLAWVSSPSGLMVNKEIVDNGFGDLFEYNETNCSGMS